MPSEEEWEKLRETPDQGTPLMEALHEIDALKARVRTLEAVLDNIAELALDSWSRNTARQALERAGDAREGQP